MTWNTQGVAGAQVWVQNIGGGGNATLLASGLNGSTSFSAVEATRQSVYIHALFGDRVGPSLIVYIYGHCRHLNRRRRFFSSRRLWFSTINPERHYRRSPLGSRVIRRTGHLRYRHRRPVEEIGFRRPRASPARRLTYWYWRTLPGCPRASTAAPSASLRRIVRAASLCWR